MTDEEIHQRIMASIRPQLRRADRLIRNYQQPEHPNPTEHAETWVNYGRVWGNIVTAFRTAAQNFQKGFQQTNPEPTPPSPPTPAHHHTALAARERRDWGV